MLFTVRLLAVILAAVQSGSFATALSPHLPKSVSLNATSLATDSLPNNSLVADINLTFFRILKHETNRQNNSKSPSLPTRLLLSTSNSNRTASAGKSSFKFAQSIVTATTPPLSSSTSPAVDPVHNAADDDEQQNSNKNSPYFLRILRAPPPNIELAAGKSVRLRCEFEGTPLPIRIKWFRNEVPLDEYEEPHRVIVRRQNRHRQAATQLRISRLSVHDTAFYRCEATTEYNTEQATTVLRVHATDLIQPPSRHGSSNGANDYDDGGGGSELTVPDFSQPDFDATGAEIITFNEPSGGGVGGDSGGSSDVNIDRLLDRSEYGMCMQYAGAVCVRELAQQTVFVQSARAMTQLEERIAAALALYSGSGVGLGSTSLTGADDERCPLSVARRALCLHVFPPCRKSRDSGSLAPPEAIEMCRDDCDMLQGELCQREFQLASQHVVLSPLLPKCELLDFTSKDNFVEPEVKCVSMGFTKADARQGGNIADKQQMSSATSALSEFTVEKCYMGRGQSYRGTASLTANNEPCKQWDALLYRQFAGHNFCRNPDTQRFDKPWCVSASTNLPTVCRIEKCFNDVTSQQQTIVANNVAKTENRPSSNGTTAGFFATPRNAYIIGGLGAGLLVFAMALATSLLCRHRGGAGGAASSLPGSSFHRASKQVRAMEERKAAYWGTNAMPYELNAFLPNSSSSSAEPSVTAANAAAAASAVVAVKAMSVSSGSSYSQEVPLKCLRFLECLGTGRFGKVYLGEMVAQTGGPRAIMVKTLMSPDRLYMKDEFYRQVTQWNDLLHPNVVSIIGINVREEPNCAVFEHSRVGDLHEFITSPSALATLNNTQLNGNHNGPTHLNEAFSSSSADSASSGRNHARQQQQQQQPTIPYAATNPNHLDINDKLRIALQIAEGLDYLHARGYNHGDVACRSCIVFDKLVVKVADYGIGHELYPDDYYECDDGVTQLPLRWMSPEAITYRAAPHQTSNVWSFGVLLWELFTNGKRPYAALNNIEALEAVQTRQLLPCPLSSAGGLGGADSATAPPQVYALMIECWHIEPTKRPTFKQLASSRIRQCQQEVAHATPTVLDSACSSTKWQHAARTGGSVRGGAAALRSHSQASHSNSSSTTSGGEHGGGATAAGGGHRLPFLMNCAGTPAASARAAAAHNALDASSTAAAGFPYSYTQQQASAVAHNNTPQHQPHPMALRGGGRLVQNRYLPAAGATSTASSSFAAAVASPRMLPRQHTNSNGQQTAPSLLDFHHHHHQQPPMTVMYNTLNRGSHARSSTQSNSNGGGGHYHNQSLNSAAAAGGVQQPQDGAMTSVVNGNSSSSRSPAVYYSNCQYNGMVMPTEAPA